MSIGHVEEKDYFGQVTLYLIDDTWVFYYSIVFSLKVLIEILSWLRNEREYNASKFRGDLGTGTPCELHDKCCSWVNLVEGDLGLVW